MKYYISSPSVNPLSRLLAAVGAMLVLAASFFFGLIVLGILLVIFVFFAVAIWCRSRWLGRRPADASVSRTRPPDDDSVIEAEYTVVSKSRD